MGLQSTLAQVKLMLFVVITNLKNFKGAGGMHPYTQRCIYCTKGSNRHLVLPLNKKARMKGTYRTIVLPSEVHFSYEENIKRSNTTFVCKILNRGTIGRSNVAI